MLFKAIRRKFVSLTRGMRKAGLGLLVTAGLAACNVGLPTGDGGGGVSGAGPVKVALLVPYGSSRGSDGTVARSLENSARLALADLGNSNVTLEVFPTKGTPAGATQATNQAVASGARVILGPLYADNAAAAGVAAAGSNVPVLSFSNNTTIAGGNVWVLGNTFENTARRLLRFAASQGRNRIITTHAANEAGQIARNAIARAANGSGAQIIGAVGYELSQAGIQAAVPGIADQAKTSGANGIFLTGNTAGDLPVISSLLNDAGIGGEEYRFIGLTRWDIPNDALSLPGLQGGYFALPAEGPLSQFRSRYNAAHGNSPHPIANLAYDGMAAIGAIAARGQTIGRGTLTARSGFAGTGGAFRLRGDGTIERALAVAQIVNRSVQVVSPAPSRFGAGS